MGIEYNYIMGWPKHVQTGLRRSIAAYAWGCTSFKIGITSAPWNRFTAPDYSMYDRMVVLYRTDSERFIRDMERSLVDYFCGHPDCDNVNAGGGGPMGEPPIYLYIVMR